MVEYGDGGSKLQEQNFLQAEVPVSIRRAQSRASQSS